ncbi:hypothetical protein [Mycobacterium paraffinicum]|nr:hypothetical protein [Mycobacterium paraffinicum]MCV7313500.1 hypothetical protein [Mycobacterium paraffinicum]
MGAPMMTARSDNRRLGKSPNEAMPTSGDPGTMLTKSRYEGVDVEPETVDSVTDALAMAEEAEAEASRAEALAAAALVRARAIRQRRAQAASSAPAAPDAGPVDTATEGEGMKSRPGRRVKVPAQPAEADWECGADELEDIPSVSRQRRSGHRILRAAAVAVGSSAICALLALSGLMIRHHQRAVTDRHRSFEFAAAAEEAAVMLLSLDFNDANEDMQRIADHSTGQFHDDFQSHADEFGKVMQASKIVMKASVKAAAVESVDGDSAVVLVAATSKASGVAAANNAPRAWRLRIRISRDGNELKMSRVEFLP